MEEEDKHKNFILVRQQPMPTSSPQATCGPWDFFQPCKNLYKQRSTRDVSSLVLFEQPSGCTLHLNWSTRDVPSLVLSYNNPSRCTLYLYHKGCSLQCVKTKKSQAISHLNLCKGKQKISQAISPLKSFV